jgi:hypothetical protein
MGSTCSQEREPERLDIYDKQRLWTTYSLANRNDRDLGLVDSDELWPGVLGFDREVIRLDRGCCACNGDADQTYGIPDVRVLEDDEDGPEPDPEKPTVTLRGAHDDMWFDDRYDGLNRFHSRNMERVQGRSHRALQEQGRRLRVELLSSRVPTAAIDEAGHTAAVDAYNKKHGITPTHSGANSSGDDSGEEGLSAAQLLERRAARAAARAAKAATAAAAEGVEGQPAEGEGEGGEPVEQKDADSDGGISPDEEDSPDELVETLVGRVGGNSLDSGSEKEEDPADVAAGGGNPRTRYRVMMGMLNGMSESQARAYDLELRKAEREARVAQRRALAASLGMTEEQVVALASEVRERERAEQRARLLDERAARRAAREEVRLAKQALREVHARAVAERRIAQALTDERERAEKEAADHAAAMERLHRVAAGLEGPPAVARETYDFAHIKFGVLTQEEIVRTELAEAAQTEEDRAEDERRQLRAERRAQRLGLSAEKLAEYLAEEREKLLQEREDRRNAAAAEGGRPLPPPPRRAANVTPIVAATLGVSHERIGSRSYETSAEGRARVAHRRASTSELAEGEAEGATGSARPNKPVSQAAVAAVVEATVEADAYEAGQRRREAAETAAIAALPAVLPEAAAAAAAETHVQVAPKGRIDPAKEVIEDGVRLINENELRWWEEKMLSKLSPDWSSFAKDKGKFRMSKAKISALELADSPNSGLQCFMGEVFIPEATPLQVFSSLYDLEERMSWDAGYVKNQVTHVFGGHPFANEIWFTRNDIPMVKSRDFIMVRAHALYRDLECLLRHRLRKQDMPDDAAAQCIFPASYDSGEARSREGEIEALSYVYRSVEHASVPEDKETLRAWSQGSSLIIKTPVPQNLGVGAVPPDDSLAMGREGCLVYFVSATDPKGSIPSFLVNTAGVSGIKDWVNKFIAHHAKKQSK